MSETEDAPREQAEIDGLLEHWKSTLALRNDQLTTFDQSILWASGGALALTIANVDKLGGAAAGVGAALLYSWFAFALSVAMNIVSYWTGSQDSEVELKKIAVAVESGAPYAVGNAYRTTTYILNFGALFLFIVGMALLIAHAYCDLRKA